MPVPRRGPWISQIVPVAVAIILLIVCWPFDRGDDGSLSQRPDSRLDDPAALTPWELHVQVVELFERSNDLEVSEALACWRESTALVAQDSGKLALGKHGGPDLDAARWNGLLARTVLETLPVRRALPLVLAARHDPQIDLIPVYDVVGPLADALAAFFDRSRAGGDTNRLEQAPHPWIPALLDLLPAGMNGTQAASYLRPALIIGAGRLRPAPGPAGSGALVGSPDQRALIMAWWQGLDFGRIDARSEPPPSIAQLLKGLAARAEAQTLTVEDIWLVAYLLAGDGMPLVQELVFQQTMAEAMARHLIVMEPVGWSQGILLDHFIEGWDQDGWSPLADRLLARREQLLPWVAESVDAGFWEEHGELEHGCQGQLLDKRLGRQLVAIAARRDDARALADIRQGGGRFGRSIAPVAILLRCGRLAAATEWVESVGPAMLPHRFGECYDERIAEVLPDWSMTIEATELRSTVRWFVQAMPDVDGVSRSIRSEFDRFLPGVTVVEEPAVPSPGARLLAMVDRHLAHVAERAPDEQYLHLGLAMPFASVRERCADHLRVLLPIDGLDAWWRSQGAERPDCCRLLVAGRLAQHLALGGPASVGEVVARIAALEGAGCEGLRQQVVAYCAEDVAEALVADPERAAVSVLPERCLELAGLLNTAVDLSTVLFTLVLTDRSDHLQKWWQDREADARERIRAQIGRAGFELLRRLLQAPAAPWREQKNAIIERVFGSALLWDIMQQKLRSHHLALASGALQRGDLPDCWRYFCQDDSETLDVLMQIDRWSFAEDEAAARVAFWEDVIAAGEAQAGSAPSAPPGVDLTFLQEDQVRSRCLLSLAEARLAAGRVSLVRLLLAQIDTTLLSVSDRVRFERLSSAEDLPAP